MKEGDFERENVNTSGNHATLTAENDTIEWQWGNDPVSRVLVSLSSR